MIVHVDVASAVPIFEQLRTQIVRLIASGQLDPGSKLPTIRDLAADLGLARGTVNKVYETLARDGFVESAGRHGTIVLNAANATTTDADFAAAADTLVLVARQLGRTHSQMRKALDEAWNRVSCGRGRRIDSDSAAESAETARRHSAAFR